MTEQDRRGAFFVEGAPAAQGSKVAFQRGGRVVMKEANDGVEAWRNRVRAACAGRPIHMGPVLTIQRYYVPRPAGHYGTGRNAGTLKATAPLIPLARSKGDVDKLARATNDGLTVPDRGPRVGLFVDDAQVSTLIATKRYVDDEHPHGASIYVEQDDGAVDAILDAITEHGATQCLYALRVGLQTI